MNLPRIINPSLVVFDETKNFFLVCEAFRKWKKEFIIRCKFTKPLFFPVSRLPFGIGCCLRTVSLDKYLSYSYCYTVENK
jgi:hypothetical protein